MTSTSPGGEQPGRSVRAGVAAGLVRGPGAGGRLTSALGWAGRWLVAWALATLVLGLVIAVLPGLSASRPAAVALAVLCVVAVRAALTPVVRALTALLPWVLVLALALVLQAGLLWLGLTVAPGVGVSSFWAAFWASWITAALAALVGWVLDVQDEDAFLAHLVRQATRGRRHAGAPQRTDAPGLLVVQLDGAPWPVIRWMLAAGNLPTLSRWVRTTHRAREWTVRVPSTTPVSQAGFLHGRTDDLPAFRWYDREAGRLVVANHPPDAALIQQRLSDGTGLLADGGASISNLFSGDAPISLLTMSGMARRKEGLGPSASYAGFLTSPYGLVRGLVRTVGEMLKELYQARQQRRRGVEPRISRHGSYVALRGFTNVLQRDLNLALVVEQLLAGTPSVFVDFPRLRRDRPPRRADPAGVAARAGGGRPHPGADRAGTAARPPALPGGRGERPRAEPGGHLPPALRGRAGGRRTRADSGRLSWRGRRGADGRGGDRRRRGLGAAEHLPVAGERGGRS